MEPSYCLNPSNSQKSLVQIQKNSKKAICKHPKTNVLKNTFKKDSNKPCITEKTYYFCTRIQADVHRKPDKRNELKLKNYFQKRFKKVCEIRKQKLPLHPAKSATLFERLIREMRRKGR
jgi:hypothetical protein